MKLTKLKILTWCVLTMGTAYGNTYAQVKPHKVLIHGTIKNVELMPEKVYLEKGAETIDSAVVRDGKYELSTDVSGTTEFWVNARTDKGMYRSDRYRIFLDTGDINIVSDGIFGKISASGKGSEGTRDYLEANKKTILLSDTLLKVIAMNQKNPSQETARMMGELMIKAMTVSSQEQAAFIRKKPRSPISVYLLRELADIAGKVEGQAGLTLNSTELESLYNLLSPEQQAPIKEFVLAVIDKRKPKEEKARLTAAAHEKVVPGSAAPDFTQNDPEGEPVSLSSFKGKYVLIDFWASWCAPCRAENPNVLKAYNTYKDKGFTVLGVSLDQPNGKTAWLDAIKKDGLPWTQVSDLKGFENAVAVKYGIAGIPDNFLIGPDGVIVANNLRGDELEKRLATIFK